MVAFLEIFLDARGDDGSPLVDGRSFDYLVTPLEDAFVRLTGRRPYDERMAARP